MIVMDRYNKLKLKTHSTTSTNNNPPPLSKEERGNLQEELAALFVGFGFRYGTAGRRWRYRKHLFLPEEVRCYFTFTPCLLFKGLNLISMCLPLRNLHSTRSRTGGKQGGPRSTRLIRMRKTAKKITFGCSSSILEQARRLGKGLTRGHGQRRYSGRVLGLALPCSGRHQHFGSADFLMTAQVSIYPFKGTGTAAADLPRSAKLDAAALEAGLASALIDPQFSGPQVIDICLILDPQNDFLLGPEKSRPLAVRRPASPGLRALPAPPLMTICPVIQVLGSRHPIKWSPPDTPSSSLPPPSPPPMASSSIIMPDGTELIRRLNVLNELFRRRAAVLPNYVQQTFLTQDCHPLDHSSFASTHNLLENEQGDLQGGFRTKTLPYGLQVFRRFFVCPQAALHCCVSSA